MIRIDHRLDSETWTIMFSCQDAYGRKWAYSTEARYTLREAVDLIRQFFREWREEIDYRKGS